jgi:hypothetical protein
MRLSPDQIQANCQEATASFGDGAAVWLFGSRAMGRHQPGSGIDLCLDGSALSQNDLLRLLAAVDDLLSSGPEAHPQMMGRRIWSAAPATNGLKSPCA